MHITQSNPEPTKAILTIKAGEDELSSAKLATLKRLAPSVKVAGFRAGHVPPAVVEKNIDPNVLQTEVLETTINKLYTSAIIQEDLRPVENPKISIKKFVPFTSLEFEAEVTTLGKIDIADYKKISHVKKEVKITKKDIDDVIERLRKNSAERKDVTRVAKLGDEATIDFKGTDAKGKPIAGADSKDYPLVLGSNAFIPGFEEEIVGLKPGDQKSFEIKFPKDYAAKALQGQKVTFDITLKKLAELQEPELDDNLAAAVGPFKNLDELKADIETQVKQERDQEARNIFENELLDKIADKSTIEIPEVLINEQIERIESEEKQSIVYRGQTWEEHLAEEGVTAEEHKEQKRPVAEKRVKIGILLSEIAELENVEATNQEVNFQIQMLKNQYKDPNMQAELDKPEVLRDIATRIRTEKVMAKLTEYATKPAKAPKATKSAK